MPKFDTDALKGIFKDLIDSELKLGSDTADAVLTGVLTKAESFLEEHSASSNYAELLNHAWVQIEQETALHALRLEREAISRFRVAILSSIRAVIVGLAASA